MTALLLPPPRCTPRYGTRIDAEPKRLILPKHLRPQASATTLFGAGLMGRIFQPPTSDLAPGAGWSGPTSDPAQQGSGPYSTREPCVYRCVTPPYPDVRDTITIQVITDHLNEAGIERVAFAVDGGTWIDVETPTLHAYNVATEWNAISGGYLSYDIDLKPANFTGNKRYELRFISYPVNGQPKVGDPFYFFGATPEYFAADPVREFDDLGSGDIFSLIDSIAAENAGNGRANNPDGGTIKINAGAGSLGFYTGGGSHHNVTIPYVPERRLNIVLGDGLTPGDATVDEITRVALPLVHYESMKLVPIAFGLLDGGDVADAFQLKSCIVNSGDAVGGANGNSLVATKQTMISRTDTEWGDTESASGVAVLIVRDNVNRLTNDCWQAQFILDSRCRDMNHFESTTPPGGTDTGRHADLLSWDDSATNTGYVGLYATVGIVGQGMETHAGDKNGMLMRDVHMDNSAGADFGDSSRCGVFATTWENVKTKRLKTIGCVFVSEDPFTFVANDMVMEDSTCGGNPVTNAAPAQDPNNVEDLGIEVREN